MSTAYDSEMAPPAQMEALILSKIDGALRIIPHARLRRAGKPGQVYHPADVKTVPTPKPGSNEVLVKLAGAAFNHRDVFIRQSL